MCLNLDCIKKNRGKKRKPADIQMWVNGRFDVILLSLMLIICPLYVNNVVGNSMNQQFISLRTIRIGICCISHLRCELSYDRCILYRK